MADDQYNETRLEEGGSTEDRVGQRPQATEPHPTEGGSTEDEAQTKVQATLPYDPGPDRFVLARLIIFSLVLMLLVHYGLVFALQWSGKTSTTLESIFNAWLPVLSGLASAAVTYYFAAGEQRK